MKKTTVLLLMFVLVSLISFVGCGDDDEQGYYISFKLDGVATRYEQSFLEPKFGNIALGNRVNSGEKTSIFAQQVGTYLSNGEPESYIMFDFENLTNSSGGFVGATNATIKYRSGGSTYYDYDFIFAITKFEAVGGAIEAKFSVTVHRGSVTNVITDGVIRVKRLADDTFSP